MNSVECTPCFVLHSKPFKDTSAIVEFLSRDYGRVSVIYKGVRSTKKTATSRILQPFQPLLATWYGNRELKSGKQVEQDGATYPLFGKKLYCGMYLNELLMRVLHRDAPADGVFEHYAACLSALENADNIELPLRQFECRLLDAIGYQLPCERDASTGAPIVADAYYRYDVNNGFIYAFSAGSELSPESHPQAQRHAVFKGELLQAIALDNFEKSISLDLLRDAKRLMRIALAPHVGEKPFESKKLFIRTSNYESS